MGSEDVVYFKYLSLNSCSFEMGYVVALPVKNTREVLFAFDKHDGMSNQTGLSSRGPFVGL